MGFYRTKQRQPLNRAGIRAEVIPLLAQELAFVKRTIDPFGIDRPCINPEGHVVISSCGAIVCAHCPVVFWS